MARKLTSLETRRLILRPIATSDAAAIHRYMSDPAVTRWLPGGPLDEAGAQAFAEKCAGKHPPALAVTDRRSRELIGHMDFHPWFGPATHEVGWAISRPHQGRGYATEAARALVAYAFEALGCHRVIATCQPENVASWRIMERLGMRREAHFRQCILGHDGAWWDEYFYAQLAEEHFAAATAAATHQGSS